MVNRTAWFDNNHEGRALRRVFNKLLKRYEKEIENPKIDLDTVSKIAHTLTLVAKTKADLAKPENEFLERLQIVEATLGIGLRRVSGVLESK